MATIVCQPKSIINVEVGTNVDVDVAIGLTEVHYEWERLHTVYRGLLTQKMYHQEPEKTKLYLFSYLGKGTTSKVYRAISESGHGCVVKLYVQNRDDGNKEMEEDEIIEFSTALASKEENNFKEIYPELSEYVWRGQLNKLQCSMMSFFDPITMDKRTSNAVIMGICQQLQRFGEKGKMFRRYNQVWRDVGYFHDPIYLFDFG